MVTGELPFKGDYDQAVVYSILNEQPEAMDRVPVELKEIIEIALAKNLEERYQNIEQLITDLKVLKDESESSQRMISHRENLKRKRFKKIIKYVIYPVLFVVVFIAGYFAVNTLSSTDIEPVSIAVVSFKNQTGDPVFDYLQNAIPSMLITDLEQSKFFQVNTWERMKDLLEQAGLEDRDYIDVEVGSQLAKMENIPILLSGSFTKIGDMFGIEIKVLDANSKVILKSAKSVGEGANSILKSQIDDLSEQIATAIDVPAREFVKTKRPLIDVTTESLEAYKYYLRGIEKNNAFLMKEAIENFRKAVQIDSTFALAHSHLAMKASYLGYPDVRDKHLDMAKRHRYKLTYKEQIVFDYTYAALKGNLQKQHMVTLRKAQSLYPKDATILWALADYYSIKSVHDSAIFYNKKILDLNPNDKRTLNLLGYKYYHKGEYRKSLEYLQRYAEIAPNEANPYDSMADIYMRINEYEKSIEMYEKAYNLMHQKGYTRHGIALNYIKMGEYKMARDLLNQILNYNDSPSSKAGTHYKLAIVYIGEGDLEKALQEMNMRDSIYKLLSDTFSLAINQGAKSEIFYENKRIKEAEEILEAGRALIERSKLSKGQKDIFKIGYLSHMVGISIQKRANDQAKKYLEMYEKEIDKNPEPNLYMENLYFMLSGLIAYADGNYMKAISDLIRSAEDDAWTNYYLALAYQNNGDKTKAIQKLEGAVNYYGGPSFTNEIYRRRAAKQLAILKAK
jgi:tetratricopeptide (TPR) repeat protein